MAVTGLFKILLLSGKIFFFSFVEKVCLIAFINPGVKGVFLI